MSSKTVLLDGAFGTRIWAKTEDKLPVWTYNITHPEVIREVTEEYVKAGSKMIQANTFSANAPAVTKEKSGTYTVEEVISAALKIAREATAGTDVKVGLDIGPLTEMLDPYGDMEEDECEEIFREMVDAAFACDNKPDYIFLETFIDLNMLVIAAKVAKEKGVPVLASMSFGAKGKTIFGNSVEDMIEEMEEIGVDAVGLNCSLGPDEAVPVIQQFIGKTELPLIFKPNAGLPVTNADGTTEQPYTAAMFAEEVKPVLDDITYIGGCCGSAPDYIVEIGKLI